MRYVFLSKILQQPPGTKLLYMGKEKNNLKNILENKLDLH